MSWKIWKKKFKDNVSGGKKGPIDSEQYCDIHSYTVLIDEQKKQENVHAFEIGITFKPTNIWLLI